MELLSLLAGFVVSGFGSYAGVKVALATQALHIDYLRRDVDALFTIVRGEK